MKKFSTLLKGLTALAVVCGFTSQANAAFPSAESLVGSYSFTSDFTLVDNQFEGKIAGTFNFSITNTSGTLYLRNFDNDGLSYTLDYDEDNGILTYKVVYWKIGTQTVYLAPGGKYTGFAATVANYLKISVAEDGTLSIPNFDIVNVASLSGSEITATYAKYSNISVEKYSDDPDADLPKPVSFEGTYAFTGTQVKYTYDEDGNQISEKSAGDFNLVIKFNEKYWELGSRNGTNYYNNIEEIAGYKIENAIDHNTTNEVEDNTITYPSAPGNGVAWGIEPFVGEEGQQYTSSLIFGGNNVNEWNQGDPAIVLTVNSDSDYSLEPFTIWLKYPVEEGSGESATVSYSYQLVYYWTNEDFIPEPDPDQPGEESPFAGEYALNGTFYNYTNGEVSSISDGFFDLMINKDGQVTAIGQNQIPLADLAEGVNMGVIDEDAGTYTLTTGPNTLVQSANPTLLLGGASTEAYAEGEKIVLTVAEKNDYSLTPFTVWRANDDGTYTLVYAWDANLYQGITVTNASAGWNAQEELEITFTANLTNIVPADVDEWLVNLEYTADNGAAKTIEAEAAYAGNTATVVVEDLEVGAYTFTLTLQAIEDDEVIATSNELTVSVTAESTAINGINASTLENGVYYNLQGVRVANPQKGIFILNGKKVIVR
ncbi:MAG: hypothetical protein J1D77_00150 [Muribaculaceae bacterium]|nr:hypothetical protein [Muribaculaceae bacterium]